MISCAHVAAVSLSGLCGHSTDSLTHTHTYTQERDLQEGGELSLPPTGKEGESTVHESFMRVTFIYQTESVGSQSLENS